MALFYILVFPGFLFLIGFALAGEWLDRKLHALMQNRIGPPWFQPLADIIKLSAKEDTVPNGADRTIFKLMPMLALTATVVAVLYVPLWSKNALNSFPGDLIVVLYLLTIPTLTFFLGGWFSRSIYSLIGAARALTQLFAYETPVNIIGFVVAMVALLGKLERVPFDIPEAETEIVAGSFTEYSGRLLGLFRLCVDVEMIVGASLIAAIFLPFGLGAPAWLAFILYLVKVEGLIFLISFMRTIMARLRIDQMVDFCWKILAPVAFVQLVLNLVLKGVVQ